MTKIFICEICGKSFENNHPQSKYCCADCANEGKRRIDAKRFRVHSKPKCTTDNQNIKEILKKANEVGLSYGQYILKQKTQNRSKKK